MTRSDIPADIRIMIARARDKNNYSIINSAKVYIYIIPTKLFQVYFYFYLKIVWPCGVISGAVWLVEPVALLALSSFLFVLISGYYYYYHRWGSTATVAMTAKENLFAAMEKSLEGSSGDGHSEFRGLGSGDVVVWGVLGAGWGRVGESQGMYGVNHVMMEVL